MSTFSVAFWNAFKDTVVRMHLGKWVDIRGFVTAKYALRHKVIYVVGINNCEGVAIDWLGRNIFWTDEALKTINVARLDNPDIRRVIVNNSLYHPRAIVLDPRKGFVYYWIK